MKNFLAAPGIKFDFIDPDNSTVRETVPGNTYEPAVANLLLQSIKSGDTVIDIGALYGYFSCFCARISPDVKVYAFDPCQSYCDVIKTNAKLNGFDNLSAVPLALSDSNSNWQFKEKTLIAGSRGSNKSDGLNLSNITKVSYELDQASTSQGKVSKTNWILATIKYLTKKLWSPPQEMSVTSIRYDDWAKTNQVKAKVAKIDVHGAEVVVLRGMESSLKYDFKHLIIEVHRTDMLVDGTYQELMNILKKADFTLYELKDFRNDIKWHSEVMTPKDIEDFINPSKWSLKNKVEMRMIYATKGEDADESY